MRYLWLTLGHLAVLLGVVGIFLPLLPTTPFLLLAAFCYGRGSERFEQWLLTHPRLGPPVREWRAHRVIRPRIKIVAVVTVAFSLGWVLSRPQVPVAGKIAMVAVMAPVLGFLLSRRSTPPPL